MRVSISISTLLLISGALASTPSSPTPRSTYSEVASHGSGGVRGGKRFPMTRKGASWREGAASRQRNEARPGETWKTWQDGMMGTGTGTSTDTQTATRKDASSSATTAGLSGRSSYNATTMSRRLRVQPEDPRELERRDGTKYVFMHHIVGNTYPYTSADWLADIKEIAAKGVDAIALNIGSSDWQRGQLDLAYAAAKASNTGLKLFYSFDLTEMPCDLEDLVARVNRYASHPNQFKVNDKVFISSFSGDCLGDSGWAALKQRTNAYLMPFVWGLEGRFNTWPSLDSWLCWGCAWPQGNYAKNTDDDNYYISQLGNKYGTTVSPWFYTHLSYKNIYLRGDDWLGVSRWEQLMAMRNTLTFVEMATWNDWGEASYYGAIRGAQPDGTNYVNGYPHTAWYDMSEYFIKAFKTGVYPTITKSVIYFWARPHPARADASGDSLGKPTGFDWTEDSMWAAVFVPSPATVTLSCGSSTQTFNVNAGVNKLKIPLAPGKMSVKMVRNGQQIIDYTPSGYTYVTNPVKYNYNAWVGSATATTEGPSSPSSSTTPAPSATPTPTWTYVGCFPDSSSSRLLVGQSTTNDANSIPWCQSRCSNAGYTYAGVEYSKECFCANSMSSSVTAVADSQCNMPCSANGSQMCGGNNRINVYKIGPATPGSSSSASSTASSTASSSSASATPTPSPTGWSSYGCVAEGTTGTRRALTGPSTTQSGMTQAICQSFCAGYNYAGVEFGTQCYCGNSLTNNGATGVIISSTSCAVKCGGDSSKVCGGSWTMTVFTKIATPIWNSAGCYVDSSSRMLRGVGTKGIVGLTTEQCVAGCAKAGYTMAGTEYGNECYCGSQIYKDGGAGVVGNGCNMACNGNSAQTCGGNNRLNLYLKPGTSV